MLNFNPQNLFHKIYLKINGLVQDCSNSIANTLALLQSCTKPSKCPSTKRWPIHFILNVLITHTVFLFQTPGVVFVSEVPLQDFHPLSRWRSSIAPPRLSLSVWMPCHAPAALADSPDGTKYRWLSPNTHTVNTMAADDLATQGARALAAMVLT